MSADLLEAFGAASIRDDTGETNPKGQLDPAWAATDFPTDTLRSDSPGSETKQNASRLVGSSNVTSIEPIFHPGKGGGNDILFDAAAEEQIGQPDDDDFGDFEDVEHGDEASASKEGVRDLVSLTSGNVLTDQQRRGGGDGGLLVDLLSMDEAATEPPQVIPSTVRENKLPPSTSSAQFGEEEDVWGDFEEVAPSQPTTQPAHVSSLDRRTSPSKSQSRLLPNFPPAPLPPDENDDWDTFEDGQSASSTTPPNTTTATVAPTSTTEPSKRNPQIEASQSAIPPNAVRPTNIPPPSTLLTLLQTCILQFTDFPQPVHVLDYQHTASRILSMQARTLRWRRDTRLAQSTRISQAGKSSGGMKLSSLNKGENMREEREAAETVEVWNGKVHLLSRLLKSTGSGAGNLNLKVSLSCAVKSLSGPGVIQATVICPVCGLKRSERLVGVDDVGVDDVFGEYWLDNWGHRSCAEWWYRWKDQLG